MGPEARIQQHVVQWAKKKYGKKIKLKKNQAGRYGSNGWPDYEVFRAAFLNTSARLQQPGAVLFIEFKAPGEKPTPLQAEVLGQLHEMGFGTAVVDDVRVGQILIEDFMKEGGW
jgi:hypothetical protein